MVQVDMFWAIGLGGTLAIGAGHQIRKLDNPFYTKYFVWTLLFLALSWAPTGMLLLLKHPSWETMQAANSFADINPFITILFGITNITQGILGYYLVWRFLRAGKDHFAHLVWLFGYFGMFFILIYGWDGQGIDRFLYDRDMFAGSPAWTPGVATAGTLSGIVMGLLNNFILNPTTVTWTLYLDGLWLLPPLIYLTIAWLRESYAQIGQAMASSVVIVSKHLISVFGVAVGVAIVCALCTRATAYLLGIDSIIEFAKNPVGSGMYTHHLLSYPIGLSVGLAISWILVLRPGQLFAKLNSDFLSRDDHQVASNRHPASQPAN